LKYHIEFITVWKKVQKDTVGKIETYFMLNTFFNIMPFVKQLQVKWQSQKGQRNSRQSECDMAPYRNDLHTRQLRQDMNVQYALQSYGWKTRNYAMNDLP
jgi:hypothetical protein